MHILTDSRQQAGKHRMKEAWFEANGIGTTRTKVPVGDYCLAPKCSVDTKRDIYELIQDIDQEHIRFRNECIHARDMGCRLVVLVENEDGVTDLSTLCGWVEPIDHFVMRKRISHNDRARRKSGKRFATACKTMQEKYGVEFRFCKPAEAAQIITEILGGEDGGGSGQ